VQLREVISAPLAALLVHCAAPMTDDGNPTPLPFDEHKLQLVRTFLQREFRTSRHEDYFDSVQIAQVFVVEPVQGPRHTLIIPKGTFEHPDFTLLCDARLVEALQSALDLPLLLMPEGAR
jgi:hypothetical protein